jgi:superfamily II DNA or RNA helicase
VVPALGPVVYWYPLSRAIHEGIVSPFVVFQTEISLTVKEAVKYDRLTVRILQLYRALVRLYPWLKDGVPFSRLQALAEDLSDPDSPVQQYLDLVLLRRELCLRAKNRLACAQAAFHKAEQKNADPSSLMELRKHMDQGITQPEWLLPPEEIREMLAVTEDPNERNRLITLRMISQTRMSLDLDHP